jgi:hypothetical protein
MNTLTTKERFVLVALQLSTHGKTETALLLLTGMPLATVTKALCKLEHLNLVKPASVGYETTYLPVALESKPILQDCQDWLASFRRQLPLPFPDDDGDIAFASSGIALLAAVLTGSRDAQFLDSITSLPTDFLAQILLMMDKHGLWWSERLLDLQETLRNRSSDLADVGSALDGVMEEFCGACWTPQTGRTLESLLEGTVSDDECDREDEDGTGAHSWIM